jgi:CHAD domain-containing protein
VTKRLGKIREVDVLLNQLEKLQSQGRPGAPALQAVIEAARDDREKAYRRIVSKPLASGLMRLDRQLHKIADGLKGSDSRRAGRRWVWALDARVVRRAVTLRRAVERAGTMYWPKRLHEVRLAIKKLRYGVELSLEASGSQDRADVNALRRGQDLLGRLHDLQILIERVRQVQASIQPFTIEASHEFDALVGSLEDDSRRLHARYVRARSALVALCDRLAAPVSAVHRTALQTERRTLGRI